MERNRLTKTLVMLAQQTNAAIELDRCVNVPVPNNGLKVGQVVLQVVNVLLQQNMCELCSK